MKPPKPNDICFCGSGLKYKKCCKDQELAFHNQLMTRDIERWLEYIKTDPESVSGWPIIEAMIKLGYKDQAIKLGYVSEYKES